MQTNRLRIAIQKNGRLFNESIDLLSRCGVKLDIKQNSLLCHGQKFPLDVLFVRVNDIPTLVADNVCDLGIVGENVLLERASSLNKNEFSYIKKLGFSRCRLSIALPKEKNFDGPGSLEGLRIATSYPFLLKDYLTRHKIRAEIMTLSGSVEIAPRLDMADAICDLVATGRTLEENNLKEVDEVIQSQALLIKNDLIAEKNELFNILEGRVESVLKAQESKYILFHAPRSSLSTIKAILPGCETPTILPLDGMDNKVAVHVVSTEGNFWDTLEKLKEAGATSILVLPIEKMLATGAK